MKIALGNDHTALEMKAAGEEELTRSLEYVAEVFG